MEKGTRQADFDTIRSIIALRYEAGNKIDEQVQRAGQIIGKQGEKINTKTPDHENSKLPPV